MVSRAFCISKHAGCSDTQVQSKYAFGEAGPIGSADGEAHEGLQVQGQKGTAGAGMVRIFPQVGKYRSLLGDFLNASLRIR